MTEKKKTQRYSISVSARTYERVRASVEGSVAGFVDDLVADTLGDPAILARLVDRCRSGGDDVLVVKSCRR